MDSLRPSGESWPGAVEPGRRSLSSRPPHMHSGVYRRSHGQRTSVPAPAGEDAGRPPSMAWSVLIAIATLGLFHLIMRISNRG